MACFIIELPHGIDKSYLIKMGVAPKEIFSCVNCFTADLTEWQIQNLSENGAILTEDTQCSLL